MKVGYNFCLILKSIPRIAFTWSRRTAYSSRTWIPSLLLTYIPCLQEIRFPLPISFIIITHPQSFTNLRDFCYSAYVAILSWYLTSCLPGHGTWWKSMHSSRDMEGQKIEEWLHQQEMLLLCSIVLYVMPATVRSVCQDFFFLNSIFSFPKGV